MGKREQNYSHLSQSDVLDLIIERYRRRTAWHRAEQSLIRQGWAICRRLCDGDKDAATKLYDKVAAMKPDQVSDALTGITMGLEEDVVAAIFEVHPLVTARRLIERLREEAEAEYEIMAKKLPIARWIEAPEQKGVSYGSLAAILGSAGNLHKYVTVQRLWKRMGLAVMPNGRQRQMRDAQLALEHGYSPVRRSVMWNVGTSLLRTQSERHDKEAEKETGEIVITRAAGPWRELYDQRKAYETAKNENGDYAEQAAMRLREANFAKTTSAYKAYSAGKLPPMHLHARAQRYVEKRFLRELWQEWRRTMEKPVYVEPETADADAKQTPQAAQAA